MPNFSFAARLIACVALLFSLAAGPAVAAESDCVLDRCADRAPPAQNQERAPAQNQERSPAQNQERAPATRPGGGFDFYVLALSWSPGFCESEAGQRAKNQCAPGAGQGFVVHGLWPQYESGFPSDCPGAGAPSRIALDHAKGLYPDEGLARHEWRKHGACSGKSPSDYFADVAAARARVVLPPLFDKPTAAQTIVPIDLERAFYAANPGLRPGMMAVSCRRGVLEDVRICFSKDLREFRACEDVVRRGCHAREIRAPAPL